MTLSEVLQRKLAEPAEPGRHILSATDETTGWTANLTADRIDPLSCLAWELRLHGPAAAALQIWADRVADRVTGLLEPLRVVEVDPLRGEAQLRSTEPSRRSDQVFYYEVLLRQHGEAAVRRFQGAQPGQHREQVAFALTHEALAKLVADLVG